MRGEKIDCKDVALDTKALLHSPTCKWCGRMVKYTCSGKLVHRRGCKRIHQDPRKKVDS